MPAFQFLFNSIKACAFVCCVMRLYSAPKTCNLYLNWEPWGPADTQTGCFLHTFIFRPRQTKTSSKKKKEKFIFINTHSLLTLFAYADIVLETNLSACLQMPALRIIPVHTHTHTLPSYKRTLLLEHLLLYPGLKRTPTHLPGCIAFYFIESRIFHACRIAAVDPGTSPKTQV